MKDQISKRTLSDAHMTFSGTSPTGDSAGNITKKWYTVEEAAEYLRKARKTIYNLRNQGRLMGVRSGGGGTLLFTLDELDAYVLGGNKKRLTR